MPSRSGETVYDDKRTPVVLERLLKSGGAGSVFTLRQRPREVAKLYHTQKGGQAYERKLRAMLELRPDLPDIQAGGIAQVQIAWPLSLLRDARGRFLGFTMPALDVSATSDLEHVLQERQARAEGLPTALGPKLTLAANLAAMLAALHRRQHYVVDLKPLNVRFYRRSLLIAMLDCDGFSIQGKGERFAAEQVTPDYLAAEFQRRGVTPGQEEAQDRFALAVMVFQLLNSGLHPYAGRPQAESLPSDLPGRIAAHLYPYARGKGDARILPSLASGHEAFPEALRVLFDRAFASLAARRPSAQEWAALLLDYARRSSGQLVECSKDGSHQHFAGMACAACARSALLAASTRAATVNAPRQPQGKHKQRKRNGRGKGQRPAAARRAAAAAPATRNTRNARAPQGARNSQAVAPPATLGALVTIGVCGPLALGWAMGWGMPAYRRYAALANPGWWDAVAVGFHGGLLLVAIAFFVLCVPLVILGKRP